MSNDRTTYRNLHERNAGKVSDKWDLYLDVYDRALQVYQGRPIRLLEIGIQNGGSLETWSRFFADAQCLVGCDIDPRCALLSFDDSRINVVVGDGTESQTVERILAISDIYDVIIEDGSHTSRDIVRSFLVWFPRVRDGGTYIAEDMHCSYWHQFGGGLQHPLSAMEFFKDLVDCVHENHWGIADVSSTTLLAAFSRKYEVELPTDFLKSIYSIEFYDSICIVRKAKLGAITRLHRRIIGGEAELVAPGHHVMKDLTLDALPQDLAGIVPGLIHKLEVGEPGIVGRIRLTRLRHAVGSVLRALGLRR